MWGERLGGGGMPQGQGGNRMWSKTFRSAAGGQGLCVCWGGGGEGGGATHCAASQV
jgi:hypothetical protein